MGYKHKSRLSIKAFDVFCSVGGLTYGLNKAGIRVEAGLDIDSSCQYAYEQNNKAKFVNSDITSIDYSDISSFLENADYKIIVGCAPCQPFSSHTFKSKSKRRDLRWNLINEFLRIVRDGKPDVISMENVPQLTKQKIYKEFKASLQNEGYFLSEKIVHCQDYGVPQSRRRLVLLASLHGKITLSQRKVAKMITAKEAIGHLPKLSHGEVSLSDPLHCCWRLSELNQKRINASIPGGSWRDWPKVLLPECYKKESGKTYSAVYGRMSWNKPAPTLTTQFYSYGTGRFGHPEQDRALSLREGALLQTFPESYLFSEPNEEVIFTRIGRHIGNAVPPLLAEAIGKSIRSHLEIVHEKQIHSKN